MTCLLSSLAYFCFTYYRYENINAEQLESAVAEGPKSVEYTKLVDFLSKELKTLCSLDEHVNAIHGPEDSSSFLLEVSSFLKELGKFNGCHKFWCQLIKNLPLPKRLNELIEIEMPFKSGG